MRSNVCGRGWPEDQLEDVLDGLEVDRDGVAANTLASGVWSLVDAAGAVARRLGSVDSIDLACWRCAARETRKLAAIGAGRVRVVYGIVRIDIGRPELAALRSTFGEGSVVVCRNHLKAAVIRGAGRVVALLTSANPSKATRLEWWTCRTGDPAAWWSSWFDHVHAAEGGGTVGRDATRRLIETYREGGTDAGAVTDASRSGRRRDAMRS